MDGRIYVLNVEAMTKCVDFPYRYPNSKNLGSFGTFFFLRARDRSGFFQKHKILNNATTTYYYFIKVVNKILLITNKYALDFEAF